MINKDFIDFDALNNFRIEEAYKSGEKSVIIDVKDESSSLSSAPIKSTIVFSSMEERECSNYNNRRCVIRSDLSFIGISYFFVYLL